jgi:hypothetical protein
VSAQNGCFLPDTSGLRTGAKPGRYPEREVGVHGTRVAFMQLVVPARVTPVHVGHQVGHQ